MTVALVTRYQPSGFPIRELGAHLVKVLPLSALAGALAWWVVGWLPAAGYIVPGVVGLSVAGGAGLMVYMLGALLLKMPEVGGILRRVKRSGRK